MLIIGGKIMNKNVHKHIQKPTTIIGVEKKSALFEALLNHLPYFVFILS